MPDLHFAVEDVAPKPYTSVPAIAVQLRVSNSEAHEAVHSIMLNCQVQLRPLGRAYSAAEEARLQDLFGARERWGQTMKPLHWMNIVLKSPPFTGSTRMELVLPCSFDFDIAANKYFYGLQSGSVAVAAMFSGTVFYADDQGALQIAQIPWDREATFHLPVEVWKAAIDAHYPDSAWLRLPRESFDRLYRYKVSRGIPMWDDVITALLDRADQTAVAAELEARGRSS